VAYKFVTSENSTSPGNSTVDSLKGYAVFSGSEYLALFLANKWTLLAPSKVDDRDFFIEELIQEHKKNALGKTFDAIKEEFDEKIEEIKKIMLYSTASQISQLEKSISVLTKDVDLFKSQMTPNVNKIESKITLLDKQKMEILTSVTEQLETQSTQINTAIRQQRTEINTVIAQQKIDFTNTMNTAIAQQKTEITSNMNTAIAQQKTEFSNTMNTAIAQQKTEITNNMNTAIAQQKTEFTNTTNAAIAQQKTEMNTALNASTKHYIKLLAGKTNGNNNAYSWNSLDYIDATYFEQTKKEFNLDCIKIKLAGHYNVSARAAALVSSGTHYLQLCNNGTVIAKATFGNAPANAQLCMSCTLNEPFVFQAGAQLQIKHTTNVSLVDNDNAWVVTFLHL